MSEMDDLKKEIFFRLMELGGRVFVVARYSDDVSVGKRGFVGEEKTEGITLVFNNRMRFDWDDVGLKATLVFGSSAEKCDVPAKDIMAIYSPELGAQFVVSQGKDPGKQEDAAKADGPQGAETSRDSDGKVIKVDFSKKEE